MPAAGSGRKLSAFFTKTPTPEEVWYAQEDFWVKSELLDAIRRDQPYNEVRRGVEASLVTAMGRMACHTGRVVTRRSWSGRTWPV